MKPDFSSIHNRREAEVCTEVLTLAAQQPWLAGDRNLLADVACVALNRLPPQYIRHDVDFSFHLGDRERVETQRLVSEAVAYAFSYVQARIAMKARS